MAAFNKKVTNRITRHIAGWAPGFAIVSHVGRHSGRSYETPVNVFKRDGGYLFALTYGEGEWVRNVLAAGTCQIRTRRTTIALAEPALYDDPSRQGIPQDDPRLAADRDEGRRRTVGGTAWAATRIARVRRCRRPP